MATLPLIEWDSDLVPLLRSCSNDLLDPLAAYITNNNKRRISSELNTLPIYRQQCPNHVAYVDEIAAEIQKFGGNTIANILRGGQGVPYRQVALDAARQLKVDVSEDADIMDIETYLLAKVWQRAFDKMSDQEKRRFFLDFGIAYGRDPKALPFMSIQALIIGGGFAAYRLSVIIANAVAKQVVGRGLSLATNRALTRSIAAYAGPVGWAITTLWAAVDMAGPAYRVTIPCVIHV